jgi:hypothetical protein
MQWLNKVPCVVFNSFHNVNVYKLRKKEMSDRSKERQRADIQSQKFLRQEKKVNLIWFFKDRRRNNPNQVRVCFTKPICLSRKCSRHLVNLPRKEARLKYHEKSDIFLYKYLNRRPGIS